MDNYHLLCVLCHHDPAQRGVIEPAVYVCDGISVCDMHLTYAESPMPYVLKVNALKEKGMVPIRQKA